MFTDYIKGYVVIKIDGIGKERFITLCGKRSIVLKNIYMQNNVYYARLSWNEYRRIPEIVHRTAPFPPLQSGYTPYRPLCRADIARLSWPSESACHTDGTLPPADPPAVAPSSRSC